MTTTLANLLCAALISALNVFSFDLAKKHDLLIDQMLDAESTYPCFKLREMGCREGFTPDCYRDLRTKWHGPACYVQVGKSEATECGDCVLKYASVKDGLDDRGQEKGKRMIREACGIPCEWGFEFQ